MNKSKRSKNRLLTVGESFKVSHLLTTIIPSKLHLTHIALRTTLPGQDVGVLKGNLSQSRHKKLRPVELTKAFLSRDYKVDHLEHFDI